MSDHAVIEGTAAALPIDNLDTDQIMPKQFLRGVDKQGLDAGLLFDLRCFPDATLRPDFVLNQLPWSHANILVGGANFGCGSSREHAVWGLQQRGIRAVIAPSFGEIFLYNAINNRLLPIVLPPDVVDALQACVSDPEKSHLVVDVEQGVVTDAQGRHHAFTLHARHRRMFLEGLDVLGTSLEYTMAIREFEATHFTEHPWARVDPTLT